MKIDCKYCGHKDNEVYLIEDCDINRHLYDWYAFECEGCGYKCSFFVVKKEPTQDNSKIICRIKNIIIERLKKRDLNVNSFLQTHAKEQKAIAIHDLVFEYLFLKEIDPVEQIKG